MNDQEGMFCLWLEDEYAYAHANDGDFNEDARSRINGL